MTPAILATKQAKISFEILEYTHDVNADSYGLEAAEKLQLNPEQVFKTLVAELDDGGLVVALLPVTQQLNLKALAKAAGAKKAQMADKTRVQRVTGYVLGGVSPLGQKKSLPTFLHKTAMQHAQVYVSAGRRGLEIALSPADLQRLSAATLVDLV